MAKSKLKKKKRWFKQPTLKESEFRPITVQQMFGSVLLGLHNLNNEWVNTCAKLLCRKAKQSYEHWRARKLCPAAWKQSTTRILKPKHTEHTTVKQCSVHTENLMINVSKKVVQFSCLGSMIKGFLHLSISICKLIWTLKHSICE